LLKLSVLIFFSSREFQEFSKIIAGLVAEKITMTATSASGWGTTSKDRVERRKFRIRCPLNPTLKGT
jgi:hypothetical protein